MSNTTVTIYIPLLIAIIAVIPGIYALFLQRKRYNKDYADIDGSASNKYMMAAKGAAEYAVKLQGEMKNYMQEKRELLKRIEILEIEEAKLHNIVNVLEKRIKELEMLVEKLRCTATIKEDC